MKDKALYRGFYRQGLFLLTLIALGLLIFLELKFFIGCILGAITLYIVLRRPFFYLSETRKWNNVVASLVIVFLTAIILILMGTGIFNMTYSKFTTVNLSSLFDGIATIDDKIYDVAGYHLIPEDIIAQSKSFLMKVLSGLLNTTYSIAANLFLMFVVLYFMLVKARGMERQIAIYMPFDGNSLAHLEGDFKNIIYSNAVGIPLIMFCQAAVATLGYWAMGIPDAVFWGFLTGLFGIVPLLGTTLIWLPISVYLFSTGAVWQSVSLAVFGLLIVSNIDNIIRLIILKKAANVHPLVTIFGVIMGIPLFGFWGIIFGPLLISIFLLLLKIYYAEYSRKRDVQEE